jgi:5-methylcytosine-specific restriction endonuclease McrA
MPAPATVMLLNATHEPLGHIDFPHAVRMLMRKVAVVVEADETRTIGGVMPWPKVLRLVRYVYEKWLDKPARWHRGGVFIRDRHKCAYCGAKATSIDHIHPASRGGEWSWLNCVAACQTCNHDKGSRTPEEAGMRLKYAQPYVPTVRELRDRARAARTANSVA